jgi:hypothetical protein
MNERLIFGNSVHEDAYVAPNLECVIFGLSRFNVALLWMLRIIIVSFRIPCKIITEVENITKIALKSLDRRRLKGLLCQ